MCVYDYRSGLGSLRRSLGRTCTPEPSNNSTYMQRKTKAALLWKKGWKKLQGLSNIALKIGKFILF